MAERKKHVSRVSYLKTLKLISNVIISAERKNHVSAVTSKLT
jgi:hypothetical protein